MAGRSRAFLRHRRPLPCRAPHPFSRWATTACAPRPARAARRLGRHTMPLWGHPPRWRAAGARRTSRRREPDRPGHQMWLRGPGGCGQRHGEGGRCPRPPRPGGRQDCRREGGDGRRRGCVQGAAGGRAGARRGPARSPVPGRAITCARARPAVVDPHSVNALGVRGSSRFTAESPPAFPLTHDALSEGAFRAGDDAWRQHGDRALEILRPLTRIAGHHRHHAEVDHCLRRRLEQQPCLCGAALRARTLQDDDGDDGRQDTAPREQPGRDRAGNEAPEARTQSECVTRRTL